MKKHVVKILIFLIVCLLLFLLYNEVTFFSVKRVEVDASDQSFESIPESFNETTIVYFSDIHYNKFMDNKRLLPFIETIQQLEPDVILFGGDLYDHPSVTLPSTKTILELTQLLDSLHAPLGKYAVLGNHDHESSKTSSIVKQTLTDGGFDVLVNQEAKLYNRNQDYISIVGIDSQLNGNPDIESAFSNHDDKAFTIVLSHTPDLIDQLDSKHVDWQLSGHTHGGQIALPFIGPLLKVPYGKNHTKKVQIVNNIQLSISNGIGTTRFDMRLFANPQIHYYTLKGE